jgi:hypothetical protein
MELAWGRAKTAPEKADIRHSKWELPNCELCVLMLGIVSKCNVSVYGRTFMELLGLKQSIQQWYIL